MDDETKPITGFAEQMFEYHRAEANFTDALCEHLTDFDRISGDYYDCSLEIMKVSDDDRLNEAAQKLIFDAGFVKVYVNHKDGWETHYSWKHSEPFKPSRGWRRRYVSDPDVTTTNVVAGTPNPGYYEISYWPDGWSADRTKDWLPSGYMRIVPDPFDPGPAVTNGQDGGAA